MSPSKPALVALVAAQAVEIARLRKALLRCAHLAAAPGHRPGLTLLAVRVEAEEALPAGASRRTPQPTMTGTSARARP